MNPINTVVDWTFLNEPLWRWGLFFMAVMFMSWGWRGILDMMK